MMVAEPHRVWRVLGVSQLNCFCLKARSALSKAKSNGSSRGWLSMCFP
jgi:hypothetical protein